MELADLAGAPATLEQGVQYPKMQMLTVGDILAGKRFNT
jgi:hypothetical protein